MANEVRRRAACDRCHSQKIRCPRQSGAKVCDRCMKAGTPCIFKPFRQKKTSDDGLEEDTVPIVIDSRVHDHVEDSIHHKSGSGRQKRKRPASSSLPDIDTTETPVQIAGLDTDPLGLDWLPSSYCNAQDTTPDIGFDNFNFGTSGQYAIDFSNIVSEEPDVFTFTNETQYRKQANLDRSFRSPSNLLPDAYRTAPGSSSWGNMQAQFTWSDLQAMKPSEPETIPKFIRRLSQLNGDLSDHKSTLPPLSIHDDVPPELEIEVPPTNEYVLEDTFRLTQSLIEIYPTFLSLFISSASSSQITTPDSENVGADTFYSDGSSPSETSSSSSSSKPRLVLDHASILLLISCHLRVIDIYEILFKHMETCISQKGMIKTARQAALTAPTLSIGNYIPPPSSAVPMQMLLLVQFASRLYDYAVDLASEIPFPKDREDAGGTVDSTLLLTKAAAENVKERAASMSQRLGSLRGEMLQSGLLA